MLKSRKIKFWANKKENENIAFRSFLKMHADEDGLDEKFCDCTSNYLRIMTAVNAEIAVNNMDICIAERTTDHGARTKGNETKCKGTQKKTISCPCG